MVFLVGSLAVLGRFRLQTLFLAVQVHLVPLSLVPLSLVPLRVVARTGYAQMLRDRRRRIDSVDPRDLPHDAPLPGGYAALLVHVVSKPVHGLSMELIDSGLGNPEHLANLLEGQPLEIVERDHEPLAVGQLVHAG